MAENPIERAERRRLEAAQALVDASAARGFLLHSEDEVFSWGIEFRDRKGKSHALTSFADSSGYSLHDSALSAVARENMFRPLNLTYLDEIHR
ncbi:hypothetical protein ACFWY9_09270 [Amycolatopsis sp. NPDC059027]|uniref:hypothetical protein n=1 Tax=unclassified Amycolatopsis TaxID=2618356 RepID=UPI00366B14DA